MKYDSKTFVLIVGCQRSGTTLLGEVLGAHPNAFLIDENDGVMRIVKSITAGAGLERAIDSCLVHANAKYRMPGRVEDGVLPDKVTHVILKVPNATFLAHRYPDFTSSIKYVFAIRDARAVVASFARLTHIPMVENQLQRIKSECNQDNYREEIRVLEDQNTSEAIKGSLIWRIKTGLYRQYVQKPFDTLTVRYEDLVTGPTAWKTKLLDHVELDPFAVDHGHEDELQGAGPGFTMRKRPIDSYTLNSWSRRLTQREQGEVWGICCKLMHELGYEINCYPMPSRGHISSSIVSAPVLAIGRGGSGTRLLADLLLGCDVFLGNSLNGSKDSIEWVDLIYELSIKSLHAKNKNPESFWIEELRERARNILEQAGVYKSLHANGWGWKLPESMLVLETLIEAFPNARVIHLTRHPVSSSFRRTHMTSRMNNPVGRATLLRAYSDLDWQEDPATDSDYRRNLASWKFQMEKVRELRPKLANRYLQVRYEDLCSNPYKAREEIVDFLNINQSTGEEGLPKINVKRMVPCDIDDRRAKEVWDYCRETAAEFGYYSRDPLRH
ncbi:sulfotransferase family protein [Wenzhouxiangella sp. EGI_FJ10305]|uniref:sulfotransferase family protein n=1 Tax=Wenzhouxiangella sp. EGI_FJ10305 TaxID=3243768 RepID=UPI0035D7F662